jgi:hypothetical protein
MPRHIPAVLILPAILAVAGLATSARAQHDHTLIDVGAVGPGGPGSTLALHTHAVFPMDMPESTLPGFTGYVMIELAFQSLEAPNAHGQVPLETGADIRIVLDSIDPGLLLYNGATPLSPGGELALGSPFFHYIPLWQVPDGPQGLVYSATFHARDAAGFHTDSAPLTFSFITVPAPTTAAILSLAALTATRRRRK